MDKLNEDTATNAAYKMAGLYRERPTLWDCVHEITNISGLNINREEAELMWRAIDAYEDTRNQDGGNGE